jgi:hypothetical protein
MTFHGRSPDDLPLAAYSNGTVADEPAEEIDAEPAHPLSQQEAVALAMGIEAPPRPDPENAEAEPAAARRGSGRPRPRLSLPRPSLPRLSVPAMPRLAFRSRAAAVADSPFHLEPPSTAMSVAQVRAALPAAVPAPMRAAVPAAMPAATPRASGVPGRTWGLDLGDLGTTLRNPRAAVRDPRVLFGGVIAIGVVLLGGSLLGGGNAPGPGPDASASAAPGIGVPAGPGPATVVVAGRIEGTFNLMGSAGFGKPTDGQLASTWADSEGRGLSVTGRVGSGMRTTSDDLVLSVTVLLDGTAVTFVSKDAECFVNMAEKMANVVGSFVCEELTSADGRTKVKITGTDQT